MRAWLTREPWNDTYELRLVVEAGRRYLKATGVSETGEIVWEDAAELTPVKPFLKLRQDAVEAIVRALSDVTQSSDQTVAALKDTQQVRDRLLTLVETVISND